MSDIYAALQKALHDRWRSKWSSDPKLVKLESAMHSVSRAMNSFIAKHRDLAAKGKFSEKGLREEVRAIAEADTVRPLRLAAETWQETVTARHDIRRKLAIPTPDPHDMAASVLRSDMRGFLRSMDQGKRMAYLFHPDVPEQLSIAAMEGPAAMAGLTEHDRDMVRNHLLERLHPAELLDLEEMKEALEVVGANIRGSLDQLRKELGFGPNDDAAFNGWMEKASAPVERELVEQSDGQGQKAVVVDPNYVSPFILEQRRLFDETWDRLMSEAMAESKGEKKVA